MLRMRRKRIFIWKRRQQIDSNILFSSDCKINYVRATCLDVYTTNTLFWFHVNGLHHLIFFRIKLYQCHSTIATHSLKDFNQQLLIDHNIKTNHTGSIWSFHALFNRIQDYAMSRNRCGGMKSERVTECAVQEFLKITWTFIGCEKISSELHNGIIPKNYKVDSIVVLSDRILIDLFGICFI